MRAGCLAASLAVGLIESETAEAAAIKLNSAADIQAHPNAVFGLAGRYTNGALGDALSFQPDFNNDYIVGGGYQHFIGSNRWGFSLGGEIGVGARFGSTTSAEVWTGGVIRQAGVTLFDLISISSSVSFGFSAVTRPDAREREREIAHNGNATFLFYLRPEIDFATPRLPDTEFFWAVQHRSGAEGILGGIIEGANAEVLGVRRRF